MPYIILTPASGGTIVDANGTVWALRASGQVFQSGLPIPTGEGTLALVWGSEEPILSNPPTPPLSLWGLSATNSSWYLWNGTGWTPSPAPPGIITQDYLLDGDLDYLTNSATPVELACIIAIQSLRDNPFSGGAGA